MDPTPGNCSKVPEGSKGRAGNTSSSSKPRTSCAKHFCFTLNNYTEEDIIDITSKTFYEKYIFQEEIAPTTGTPHLQGYIMFTRKCRPKGLFKNKNIHWEKSRCWTASEEYCSKSTSKKEGGRIWRHGYPVCQQIKVPKVVHTWIKHVKENPDASFIIEMNEENINAWTIFKEYAGIYHGLHGYTFTSPYAPEPWLTEYDKLCYLTEDYWIYGATCMDPLIGIAEYYEDNKWCMKKPIFLLKYPNKETVPEVPDPIHEEVPEP